MLIFMWAGQANTPPGLFWALYYILKHPHVRQKIMEEFKDLLKTKRQEADPDEANNNMPEQNVSLDDILNLEKEDLDKLILLSMFCDNHTVKPRLSNAFVLDQIGFRPKNCISDFEHEFGSRPNRKKTSEHKRALVQHMSAFFTRVLV